jgi:hypothetical protein
MVKVGNYVQHRNGTTGRVRLIEGAYCFLENDSHRYAVRLLTPVFVAGNSTDITGIAGMMPGFVDAARKGK